MPLLFLLALILTIFLKRNPNLKKIFIIAILGHLLLLGFIYVYTALCVPRGIAFDDGDVFSQHAGIISFVLRDIDFNRAYLYEEIGTEGNYFDAFFGKKLIPPADSYAIGFITYFYSIIFAAYGYIPVFIHILNILLNLLTGIIIFKLSKILFNQQTALFALILFLFNPVTFYYATTKLKEPLYFFASFLSIFFSVLAVKKKNIAYLVLNVPLLILVKLTKWAYFYPLLLTILIYLVLNFFSKRRLLIIVGLILIGMFIFLNRGFVYEKEREIFGAAEGMHKGHLTAIGYNYNLLIFGPELTQYTIKQKVIYTINAWYHLTFEPLLSNNISFRLLFYYPIKIVWIFLCILGFFGALSSFRYSRNNSKENILLLLFLFLIGTVLAISSGNVGTMLRHRGIIEPIIFIYASYFISTKMSLIPSDIKNSTIVPNVS